jgi:uncharacterized membrane protein YfcA
VLGTGWTDVVALAAAFVIAALSTPAGISGAVLLLPFQVRVLGTPSPAVTSTNLLFNVVATPGALYRYWRQRQTGGRLALVLIAGTVPGVIAGSVIRVELLPGPRVFDLVVAAVLLPLGTWLALTRPAREDETSRRVRAIPALLLLLLGAAVGCVGGIYGLGGGSILASILIGTGRRPSDVAPAALASTFVTSVARRDHLHRLVGPRAGIGRPELANRNRTRHRRPSRCLHRCPSSVPPARCPDPPPDRNPGRRHRRPLPRLRLGLTALFVGRPWRHLAGRLGRRVSRSRSGLEDANAARRQADLDRITGGEVEAFDVAVEHQRRDRRVAVQGDAGERVRTIRSTCAVRLAPAGVPAVVRPVGDQIPAQSAMRRRTSIIAMGLAENPVVLAQASGTRCLRAWCALLSITYDIRWRVHDENTMSAHHADQRDRAFAGPAAHYDRSRAPGYSRPSPGGLPSARRASSSRR